AAMGIGEDLDFDVARLFEIFFKKDAGIAESVEGFGGSVSEARGEFGVGVDQAHAFTAAAGNCFEEDRVAHTASEFLCGLRVVDGIVGAGDGGNFGAAGELAAGGFCAKGFHSFGRRADKRDVGVGAGAGERCIFGKKAVARVDGVASGPAGDVHNL